MSLLRSCLVSLTVVIASSGCGEDEKKPKENPKLDEGEACDPAVVPIEDGGEADGDELLPVCADGLACEPTEDGTTYVCGTELAIQGRVIDALSGEPVEGALVAALSETGEPVTDVVRTDACGDYVLPVSVRRAADGGYAETPKWTIFVSAEDYLPFPEGARPSLPIDAAEALPDPDGSSGEESDGELYVRDVIDSPATNVRLIPLEEQGGATITGTVGGDGDARAGTLVVGEGTSGRAPYAIADASGSYTLFNLPAGGVTIRGYRRDLQVEPATVEVTGDALVEDVNLPTTATGDALATVTGSLGIVDAPGGAVTSVVLIPGSLFNPVLERGAVPFGLREPDPPLSPNVTASYSFEGVPDGTYKVLVAFENDDLVRDPDTQIAGTEIQEITVSGGGDVTVDASFKVTAALEIVGPGAEAPEEVDATPTLSWADDSSEDGYELTVFDALGNIVWETDVPAVQGSATAEVTYGGPALEPGMYYQFRVFSYREAASGRTYISRTEDLRGVFFTGAAPPAEACTIDGDGDG